MEDKKWRKFGAKPLTVTARVIADVQSGKGKVVQTVRDEPGGELVSTESFNVDCVESEGLPIPNPLDLIEK